LPIYASRRQRISAALIDSIILAPIAIVTGLVFLYLPTLFVVVGLYLCMVPTLYLVVFTVRSGQTPGRRWLGQKVTRPNGQLLSYRAAFLREIASLVNGLIFWFQGLYLVGMMKRLNLPSLGLEKALELSAELPRSGLDSLSDAVYWFVWTSLVCTFLNEKKRTLEDFVAGSVVVVEASESADGLAKGR
jgi:uncharacterized RDD family membrane protein YckC